MMLAITLIFIAVLITSAMVLEVWMSQKEKNRYWELEKKYREELQKYRESLSVTTQQRVRN
jgi:FtsZ-interacting cell division protein ZipA